MSVLRSALALACAAACAVPLATGVASAATPPKVVAVSPLHLGVGETLTIRGKNFIPGKNRNWVVFQRARARAVFAPVDSATSTKLTFVVPAKLLPFLSRSGGKSVPTRFSLRVLARRFARQATPRRLSPVIGPVAAGKKPPAQTGDCINGVPTGRSPDSDRDGLSDSLEKSLKTNPCNADSDLDGITDGYEYEAALDLNSKALPYPGKRPYPNALFPDAGVDYDGDGMTQMDEYSAWVRYGGARFPLNYSDGTQNTGGPQPVPPTQPYLDLNHNGSLSDDERDVDGDGLGNWIEAHGPLSAQAWWSSIYTSEQPYGVAFAGTDWLDSDTDGDALIDGQDDQDHDGYNNLTENFRGPWWVNPFNPCLPDPHSPTCSLHPPVDNPWPPFSPGYSPTEPIPLAWPRP
jgi:hypothetical protein